MSQDVAVTALERSQAIIALKACTRGLDQKTGDIWITHSDMEKEGGKERFVNALMAIFFPGGSGMHMGHFAEEDGRIRIYRDHIAELAKAGVSFPGSEKFAPETAARRA